MIVRRAIRGVGRFGGVLWSLNFLMSSNLECQHLYRDSLPIGTMVRMTFKSDRVARKGRLLQSLYSGSVDVVYCTYPQQCALTGTTTRSVIDLMRLEMWTGDRSRTGMFVGGAVGAAFGLLVAGLFEAESQGSQPLRSAGLVIGGAGILGAVGAFMGAQSISWRDVRLRAGGGRR